MKLYFVRHGETKYNAEQIYQPPTSELSARGREQANVLAKRFQSITIDVIFSSPFTRALQTAEIIARTVHKEIVPLDLLKEIIRPSEVHEKHVDDTYADSIIRLFDERAEEKDWHYSDEENFYDIQQRTKQLVCFLHQRPEEHILCVTHGFMLKIILATCMFGEELTHHTFQHLNMFKSKNTGITLLEKGKDTRWRLITWNDHAHLG